nr:response regulator [bacterium]
MKIRVLIVDDSAFMRVTLTKIIESEEIVVCGTARDGVDALAKIPLFQPNVIMLDVQMPNMDGIECLKRIMELPKKIPVIMFSSMTIDGAAVTLE